MVGIPLTYLDEASIAHLTRGGRAILLLSANIETAEQLRTLTSDVRCAADAPVLVAVDQEFGPVDRLGNLITPLPPAEAARESAPEDLEEIGRILGAEMIDLGINVDLAPVVDVVRGPNPVLDGRHLGDDPVRVGALGAAFAAGLSDAGVVAVAKHFPGHGGSAVDPHDEVTPIALSREELARVDWIPFETVIAAGIEAVMVGHPVYDALDPGRPASLSPPVYELLRSEFGFDGVALTDALNMPAVTTGRTVGEIAVAALAAGADLLVNPAWSATEPTVAAIVAAVASGDLSIDRLSEAASRVEALAASAAPVTCALQSGS